LAFGESIAFFSLVLPATVVLVGAGGLIAAADIPFWPVWGAAFLGAVFGDWLSYWLGYHFSDAIGKIWPLSRHPELLPRGQRFFKRWGVAGVFLGRYCRYMHDAAGSFPDSQRVISASMGVWRPCARHARDQMASVNRHTA
jgi:membrane protein DedA with SNARE-associated domain